MSRWQSRATWWRRCGPQGKQVDFLVFDNEGHDVIKFENKVRCYNEIVTFFVQHL